MRAGTLLVARCSYAEARHVATEALTRERRLVSEGEFYGRHFARGVLRPALRADDLRLSDATTG